ncbi:hypothetical protein RFI_10712 [Reticulomyxa filosa]|uniref:Pentacotripeptide-repeat region of PRORP domain-containing protein n=1 Tax=Reticulomyxa filosa TaxID=46433 RepID=X6NJF9_RETFI|nr:hypothetical protein RFI_10712 [Reticulomyxa filosa]|eukprot:ETO26425.1 hypothetical protein RFI_10712 [Reticulomyxa filosa]
MLLKSSLICNTIIFELYTPITKERSVFFFQLKVNTKFNNLANSLSYNEVCVAMIITTITVRFFKCGLSKKTQVEDILQHLKFSPCEDCSIYSVAIKKCSELKRSAAIPKIIQIAHAKQIQLTVIFCGVALDHLGRWNKFDLQKYYFERWFNPEQHQFGDKQLIPDCAILNIMISMCRKQKKIEQALNYLQLMIDKHNIKPALSTYTFLLSFCGDACDMKNAELIWNQLQNDSSLKIDTILLNAMLNVYAKCGKAMEMMKLLNDSQTKLGIPINAISCTIVLSGFLKANKVQEMFDFCDNHIPDFASKNVIDLKNKKLISLKGVGHLKIMETLNADKTERLAFHHQQFLNIFQKELYPNVESERTSIYLPNMKNLVDSYILLNKKCWMKGVRDIERILSQKSNYIHSFNYWNINSSNKHQTLLDFRFMSTTMTIFFLRYLMTYQRDLLKKRFEDNAIKILRSKSQFLKTNMENELKQWKVPIRLEQNKENLMVWCLNPEDVLSFFLTVPSGQDLIANNILMRARNVARKCNATFHNFQMPLIII